MTPADGTGSGDWTLPDDARPEAASVEQCLAALSQARDHISRRGPVDIRLVRRSVGDVVPRRVLDACLLQLEAEGSIVLTPHARPEVLDPLELLDCVPSPRGPLYFVTWRG